MELSHRYIIHAVRVLTFILCMLGMTDMFAQKNETTTLAYDSTEIIWRDTAFNLVFDSLEHDLGWVAPVNKNN